jgi:hypothetical protein
MKGRLRNHNRDWTEEDDDVFRTMLSQGVSLTQIAFKLRRTRIAIVGRARNLRIPLAGKLKAKGTS